MTRITVDTRKHVKIAEKAVKWLHKKIPTQSSTFGFMKCYQNLHNEKAYKIAVIYSEKLKRTLEPRIAKMRRETKDTSNIFCIAKHKVANCGELTRVLQTVLAVKFGIIAKSVNFETGRAVFGKPFYHSFLVINFSKKFKADNIHTWGEGAFIVDPWLKFVLPVKKGLSVIDQFLSVFNLSKFVKKEDKRLSHFYKNSYKIELNENCVTRHSLKTAFQFAFKNAQSNFITRKSGDYSV